jgi:predicted glycosyltransferase involved in capsule biosynthesis
MTPLHMYHESKDSQRIKENKNPKKDTTNEGVKSKNTHTIEIHKNLS